METIVQSHDTARIGNSGDGAQTDKPNRIIVDWPVFRFGYLDSRVSNKRTMTTVGRRKCDGRSTGVRAPTIGRTSGGRKTKGRTRRPSLKWWWGGTLRQTYVTQRLTTAANSCGKVRSPAPTSNNPTSSALAGSPTERIRQDASSIPICGIEPASAIGQVNRTGLAILGLRAWLAVWRLADLERIRSIAWLWW